MESSNTGDDGFTIYWRIENFPCRPGHSFTIESPVFEIKSLNSKFQLEMIPRNDCLRMYFFKRSNPVSASLSCTVSILTGLGWYMVEDYEFTFELNKWISTQILSLEDLVEEKWYYLPNGSLTVSFHISSSNLKNRSYQRLIISKLESGITLHRPTKSFTDLKPKDFLYFPGSCNSHPNEVPTVEPKKIKQFKTQYVQTDAYFDYNEMEDLLKLCTKELSFVTLRTPSEKFTVHKALLCAKSPVFNAMFGLEMRENDSNLIDIADIEDETMASLINFLHCQPFGNLSWDSAVKLYYAADKYQIDGLKKECVSILKEEMSADNVCEGLLLAYLHQDKNLMTCAQEHFCKNSKVILSSSQWKELLGHTDLIAEILSKLSEEM